MNQANPISSLILHPSYEWLMALNARNRKEMGSASRRPSYRFPAAHRRPKAA
jgi:hypothetical protein